MRKRDILVVEDDSAIRQGIVDSLDFAGYNTFEAKNGKEGLELALEAEYDLILLDLILPHFTGLEILQKLREARVTQPVIILTAKGEESDRVKGLSMGADDYVVKPFSVKELLARIEAVLRRSPERPDKVTLLEIAEKTIDLARSEVRLPDGSTSSLSERENQLLSYLACNPKRAISREEILTRVWQLDPNLVATRTIDMHIARLREKLQDSEKQEVLQTVRGKGYRLGS